MQNDEKFLILEQYRIYSEAKEAFTTRNFGINRFYLIFTLVLFLIMYIIETITPSLEPLMIGGIIGMAVCAMWWLNIDSYQTLIRIKYASVLEEIEKLLPVAPYKMESEVIREVKKNQKPFFSDFQKTLAAVLFIVNIILFSNALILMLTRTKF